MPSSRATIYSPSGTRCTFDARLSGLQSLCDDTLSLTLVEYRQALAMLTSTERAPLAYGTRAGVSAFVRDVAAKVHDAVAALEAELSTRIVSGAAGERDRPPVHHDDAACPADAPAAAPSTVPHGTAASPDARAR